MTFYRILVEPDNALIKQYQAFIGNGRYKKIEFSDDAIRRIAEFAYEVNQNTDNIGAGKNRHTISRETP